MKKEGKSTAKIVETHYNQTHV